MNCPICNRRPSADERADVKRLVSGFLTITQLSDVAQASGSDQPVASYCGRCLISEMAAAV